MLSELNKRITFQAPKKISNGRGGVTIDENNPVVIGTFWAKVEVKSKALATLYQGQRLESNIFITIRDNPAINESCQAIYEGRPLQINEITPAKKIGYTVLAASGAVI